MLNKKLFLVLLFLIIVAIGTGFYFKKSQIKVKEGLKQENEKEQILPPDKNSSGEKLEGKVINQLTADLKGNGQPQLVALVAKPSKDKEFVDYFVRIFSDEKGKTIEWEGPAIESISETGDLSIIYNPATNRLTIEHDEAAGAHGQRTQFIHWTGSHFEEIKAVDENGRVIQDPFFGDSGVFLSPEDGKIEVSFRNPDCPLDASIDYEYKWNGVNYQLEKKVVSPCPSG